MYLIIHIEKVYTDNVDTATTVSQLTELIENCICRIRFRETYAYTILLNEYNAKLDLSRKNLEEDIQFNEKNEIVKFTLDSELLGTELIQLECFHLKKFDKT